MYCSVYVCYKDIKESLKQLDYISISPFIYRKNLGTLTEAIFTNISLHGIMQEIFFSYKITAEFKFNSLLLKAFSTFTSKAVIISFFNIQTLLTKPCSFKYKLLLINNKCWKCVLVEQLSIYFRSS